MQKLKDTSLARSLARRPHEMRESELRSGRLGVQPVGVRKRAAFGVVFGGGVGGRLVACKGQSVAEMSTKAKLCSCPFRPSVRPFVSAGNSACVGACVPAVPNACGAYISMMMKTTMMMGVNVSTYMLKGEN